MTSEKPPKVGPVKALPRDRFYMLRVGGDYVRRLRPGEPAAIGERFHIHSHFVDALRFATLCEAEEELDLLLTQLRAVPGYADCRSAVAAIEMHETVIISSAIV